MKTCQDIMLKGPACCLAQDKVITLAQRMEAENIDTLLVVEDFQSLKLIGIVTDRDIALRVVGKGQSVVTTEAHDVMTTNPFICHPADDLEKTLKDMETYQITRVPVVDKEMQVVGIIIQARSIQARVSIRLDNENNISAFTIKDDFAGWSDFADRIRSVVKRITLINNLSQSLTDQDDEAGLAAM